MNTVKTGDTVQTTTRDVGKVREVIGKTVVIWSPYSGIRSYPLDSVKKLY